MARLHLLWHCGYEYQCIEFDDGLTKGVKVVDPINPHKEFCELLNMSLPNHMDEDDIKLFNEIVKAKLDKNLEVS